MIPLESVHSNAIHNFGLRVAVLGDVWRSCYYTLPATKWHKRKTPWGIVMWRPKSMQKLTDNTFTRLGRLNLRNVLHCASGCVAYIFVCGCKSRINRLSESSSSVKLISFLHPTRRKRLPAIWLKQTSPGSSTISEGIKPLRSAACAR